ncbi:MAG: glycosyltransferase family 2 protein [Paramuribaculum sp.]|nr:glycosyltransferase family 2 protein [Paramuribaculum sp.]
MTTLDIAIVTHTPQGGEKVGRMLMPPMDGVRYVVSWQNHGNAPMPSSLIRSDVVVHRFDGKGVAANRNNALEHCTADIVLMGDDDLIYNKEGIARITEIFDGNPTLDLATFRCIAPYPKKYPEKSVRLGRRLPENYNVGTVEIACRRQSVAALRFCTELGKGSERFHSGEDEYFLYTAINRGLECRFFPIDICEHDHYSTGFDPHPSKDTLRGFGCIIALMYPWTCIARIPLKAWRLFRSRRAGFFKALVALAEGAIGAPGVYLRYRKN